MESARPVLLSLLFLHLAGCAESGPAPIVTGGATGNNSVVAVEYGKLVDVYGLRSGGGARTIELYRADVLIAPSIPDQRDGSADVSDAEIEYDFLSANPDSLQPRLLITRPIGTPAFAAAFARLDDEVRTVSPAMVRSRQGGVAMPLVPRNAGIRVTFSEPLGVDDDFFYTRDPGGAVTGIKNAAAVQLLAIVGDPSDAQHARDFRQIPARVVVRGRTLLLDPVLLGTEGVQLGVLNTAAGLPASADQRAANIRLAFALEGPLAIPGLRADQLVGRNNDGARSIVRDFRAGNPADSSPDIARGFVRDPVPPRLVGELPMYVEGVGRDGAFVELTLYKNHIVHEVDGGDVLRLYPPGSAAPIGAVEILRDPADDRGDPAEQYVRVLVRPLLGGAGEDLLAALDPALLPGYPPARGPEREAFLRRSGARAVLVAEFTHRRPKPAPEPNDPDPYYGDDSRYFLTFSPHPEAGEPARLVSPFADLVVRFSKPVDLDTVDGFDSVFVATRDVLTWDSPVERPFPDLRTFIAQRDIEPASFDPQKFRTPHLVAARVVDASGSQTAIRLRTPHGFYLDEAMREAAAADASLPYHQRRYHYFLHLLGGARGVRDLSGNPLDFQSVATPGSGPTDFLTMEFDLETRYHRSGEPRAPDNLAVSVVRRFTGPDEDEHPSYYRDDEITRTGQPTPARGVALEDVFGPVAISDDGELLTRSATRVRRVVDNLNQLPPQQQGSVLRWCPATVNRRAQIANGTAATPFGLPIQNPLNPYGCRLQMVWREIDMSLSRTDPLDFNLDVEQMYWAPFAGNAIIFDEFDRVSLFLGHAEFRPEPCIDAVTRFPSLPRSGLQPVFQDNYARNRDTGGGVERQPRPHPAFTDKVMTINANNAVLEPNEQVRYLPLPKFEAASEEAPLFVWRDERETVQGGQTTAAPSTMAPYIVSPFNGGLGARDRRLPNGQRCRATGAWDNARNQQLVGGQPEALTDGLLAPLALPLLADFWVYPDSPERPFADPFLASGINGWQISLATTSGAQPNFRVYSGGRTTTTPPVPVGPNDQAWRTAVGGWDPVNNRSTPPGDNTVYWVMADFLKRTSVVTAGFVDLRNPHRMPAGGDPRLGPYDTAGRLPSFDHAIAPAQSGQPAGTAVVTEFRAASALDPAPSPAWPRITAMPAPCGAAGPNRADEVNFPLDPYKAGDAGLRHYDNRPLPGTNQRREWWTHPYNRTVTDYTERIEDLVDPEFTNRHAGPYEAFHPAEVRYFNWRFVMRNNAGVTPPTSPKLDAFFVAYRLEPR